jgi:CDGSH-type Zn-finger protein/mannose-6-phosphate isomerase-like protein (cupin superfamily)
MTPPVVARLKGCCHEVQAGRRYLWCACGLSKTQPFCDGSHQGTGHLPLPWRAAASEAVIFCGCKRTCTPPFCDGSHNNLEGAYVHDDPDSETNRAILTSPPAEGPVRRLDGACYVFSPSRARMTEREGLKYCAVISRALGSVFQSQFYAEVPPGGVSPVIAADGRHVVLFVQDGEGGIEIGERRFPLRSLGGVYIRPTEAFRLHATGIATLKLFISNGPGSEDLAFLGQLPAHFDAGHPRRNAVIDPSQRHGMGERFYQMLISREHGSDVITQFIGNIPLSKALPHRHLYEEALIFLRGAGVVWTQSLKAPVQAGDVLFLPSRLLHSVQCTVAGGLHVVGVIYPGDNPSINY